MGLGADLVNALAVECWGGVLKNDCGADCDKSFVRGRRHMKNKFCDRCRGRSGHGLLLPAERVRGLPSQLNDIVVNSSEGGVWSIAPAVLGEARFRVVNNTAGCSRPRLVIFEQRAPDTIDAPAGLPWSHIPETWIQSDGTINFCVSRGTLIPAADRKKSPVDAADRATIVLGPPSTIPPGIKPMHHMQQMGPGAQAGLPPGMMPGGAALVPYQHALGPTFMHGPGPFGAAQGVPGMPGGPFPPRGMPPAMHHFIPGMAQSGMGLPPGMAPHGMPPGAIRPGMAPGMAPGWPGGPSPATAQATGLVGEETKMVPAPADAYPTPGAPGYSAPSQATRPGFPGLAGPTQFTGPFGGAATGPFVMLNGAGGAANVLAHAGGMTHLQGMAHMEHAQMAAGQSFPGQFPTVSASQLPPHVVHGPPRAAPSAAAPTAAALLTVEPVATTVEPVAAGGVPAASPAESAATTPTGASSYMPGTPGDAPAAANTASPTSSSNKRKADGEPAGGNGNGKARGGGLDLLGDIAQLLEHPQPSPPVEAPSPSIDTAQVAFAPAMATAVSSA